MSKAEQFLTEFEGLNARRLTTAVERQLRNLLAEQVDKLLDEIERDDPPSPRIRIVEHDDYVTGWEVALDTLRYKLRALLLGEQTRNR